MRGKVRSFCLVLALAAGVAAAQEPSSVPNPADVYCSGVVTNEAVPYDTYVISGEESNYRLTFWQGEYVYINKGASQGVKVGDEFLVTRPVKDPGGAGWFMWQSHLLHAIGRQWADLGRLRVVVVHPNVSIAQIVYACDLIYRGDHVLPFAERPAPPIKTEKLDRFAPPSGRPIAMVVTSKDFRQVVGAHDVIYVNLGRDQGVKVGDYVRIFRYQGTRHEAVYQDRGMAYKLYGFGSAPARYRWDNLPREVLGEGVVLRVAPNAATVLITASLREIYLGDYIELE